MNYTTNIRMVDRESKAFQELQSKMGLTHRETKAILIHYGVSAARLMELMQLSRYEFIHNQKITGRCEPCTSLIIRQKNNYAPVGF
jgi:hypothetical protein